MAIATLEEGSRAFPFTAIVGQDLRKLACCSTRWALVSEAF